MGTSFILDNVKKYKLNLLIFFFILFVFGDCLCASAVNTSKDVFVIADAFKALPIHPFLTNSTISADLLDLLYDPLIEVESNGSIKPALAREWKISNDGLEWSFLLVKGVKFHDGTEMTAYDVKATYEAVLASENSFYAFGFSNIKKIDVVSAHEVKIDLKRFDDFLPFFLRHVYIIPEYLAKKKSRSIPIIGTGPFKLDFFSPEHIELVAHENYFRGRTFLRKILVDIYPNQRSCLSSVIAGKADMTLLTDVKDFDIFSNVRSVSLISYPVEWAYFVIFNSRNPLFADEELRVALNYAVNVERLRKYEGTNSLEITSGIDERKKEEVVFNYPYSPSVASDMVKRIESVLLRKKRGKSISFNLVISEADDVSKRIATSLKFDFESIGVNVRIDTVPSYDELAMRCYVKRDYDTVLMPSNMRSGMQRHYLFWHSSQIKRGGNFSGYNNPEVDRLLDEIRYNPDPQSRKEAEKELVQALRDDPPGIPLFVKRVPALVNEKFVGFSSDPFDFFSSLRNVKIKEDK